jgi:hypothetical protein
MSAPDSREWIFTFGHGHTPNQNYFVRITGTFEGARLEMFRRFGRGWSMQYESEDEAGVARFGLREYQED